jgi:4-hydroxy-tetrahydrodipicolinate synthase
MKTAAGAWPVMLTPFDAQKRIDWPAFDRLVEWYLAAGVEGLFAVCLSSDIFQLDADERLALARRTVQRAAGRAPVIAAGAFGGTPVQTAEAVNRLADTGVDAVILLTNQFARQDAPPEAWQAAVETALLHIRPGVALGLYECPVPCKRFLTPALTRWAAQTGRFHFLKDTCCDMAQIEAKLAVLSGTPLRFYNAHTATLLPSLLAGGHGFSGCGANAVPHLYSWLCKNFAAQPERTAALQAFLNQSSPAVDNKYPASVKTYLRLHGLPMTTSSRLPDIPIDSADIDTLHAFQAAVRQWEELLNLPSPFASQ